MWQTGRNGTIHACCCPLIHVWNQSFPLCTGSLGSGGAVSVWVAVVSSVLLFLVGLVGGFAAGALVGYCCTHHRKPHPPLPAPLYEDVAITTRPAPQELKLQDNVAYGHIS